MEKPIQKLISNYGEAIIAIITLLVFGGFMTWVFSPFYTLIFTILLLVVSYFLLRKTGSLYFFENHIILRAYFGKRQEQLDYDNIDYVEYRFATAKGISPLTVYFKSPVLSIKAVAYGSESLPHVKRLALFLKSKKIRFVVIPKEKEYKIIDNSSFS